MKKRTGLASALITAFALSSCGSSHGLEGGGIDGFGPQVAPVAGVTTVQEQSEGIIREQMGVLSTSERDMLRNYNVVVGSFRNRVNAENFKAVMYSRGYNPFIVTNSQGLFRVVAGGFDTLDQARSVRAQLRSLYPYDDPNTTPRAWILIPLF